MPRVLVLPIGVAISALAAAPIALAIGSRAESPSAMRGEATPLPITAPASPVVRPAPPRHVQAQARAQARAQAQAQAQAVRAPVTRGKTSGDALEVLVPFAASAFPYDGDIPDRGGPFLDAGRDGRRGHTAPRHGVYWEDPTYADRRVLLSIPAGLDWTRPITLVVFFHGNQATLRRDVMMRQEVPRQVRDSGLDAILVAPQLAVDALDSSAGHFWERGFFARFMDEAVARIASLAGDPRAAARLAEARIVVMAYSGGYLPAAFALERGGLDPRIACVLLFDGLYAEEDRFAAWIAEHPNACFFSAHSPSTREPNLKLQRLLTARGIRVRDGLPERLTHGSVHFLATSNAVSHDTFLTRAWTDRPIRAVLSILAGRGRRSQTAPTADTPLRTVAARPAP